MPEALILLHHLSTGQWIAIGVVIFLFVAFLIIYSHANREDHPKWVARYGKRPAPPPPKRKPRDD